MSKKSALSCLSSTEELVFFVTRVPVYLEHFRGHCVCVHEWTVDSGQTEKQTRVHVNRFHDFADLTSSLTSRRAEPGNLKIPAR